MDPQVKHQLEDLESLIAGTMQNILNSGKALEPEIGGVALAFDYLRQAADVLDTKSLAGLRHALKQLDQPLTAQNLERTADLLVDVSLKARDAANLQIQKQLAKDDKEIARQDKENAKKPNALAQKFQGMTGGVSGLGKQLSSTIGALLGPFQSLAGSIGPFVEALNPSVMQAFNYVMRNLMATIGVALLPVINVLKGALQALSVTLYPAMKALAPIFENLTNILIGNLIPIVGMMVDLFVALAPLIEFITDLMSTWADMQRVLMTVLRTVFQTLYQSIASMFGGVDLKNIADQFRQVLQTVTKYFVLFAAYMSRWIASLTGSSNNFIDNLLKNLGGLQGKGEHAIAAPQNVGMKGFEQIGKDMAVAAFTAQKVGGKKETNDFLADIFDAVKEMQGNSKTIQDFLSESFEEFMKFLEEKFGIPVDGIRDFVKELAEFIMHPVDVYNRKADAAADKFVQNNPDATRKILEVADFFGI